VLSAKKVLESEQKITGKIREDKKENFPPLPKDMPDL